MARNSLYSNIRTYAELESSIRMVRRQVESNPLSQGVSQFRSVPKRVAKDIDWADVAAFLIHALQNYLRK